MIKKILYTILLTVFLPVLFLFWIGYTVYMGFVKKVLSLRLVSMPFVCVGVAYGDIWKSKPVAEAA